MEQKWLEPRIEGTIIADEVIIGHGAVVEKGVIITGKGKPAKRVVLGEHSYVGQGTKIFAPECVIGDYTKLNERSFCHGELPIRIGRNCWFGGGVILDSMGGLDIDDNVGVGAGSQLWTHAQFGDVVEGCRFHSHEYMHIGKDAWFVGHCLVSPVKVAPRSMAMLGAVITNDMLENHIYAGVPAKDLTDKLGNQFVSPSIDEKIAKLNSFIEEFELEHPEYRDLIKACEALPQKRDAEITHFSLLERTYSRTRSAAEIGFLKKYVPLIKFHPDGEGPMYVAGQTELGSE